MKLQGKQYTKQHKTRVKQNFSAATHWTNDINRRDFIKSTLAVTLLAPLLACKPQSKYSSIHESGDTLINQSGDIVQLRDFIFSEGQHRDLLAVYMRLFPDDGDGPSAADLNILTYLEWALTDERNKADGDAEFIIKGLGWLNQYASDKYSRSFIELSKNRQDIILESTSKSDQGKRWLSILSYYLIEALTLDPYYGGNTNQVGWNWLQHQGGFPQPVAGKTYRDFS